MLEIFDILKYLQDHLSPKRYTHSINVRNIAGTLARYYGCDEEKAKLAGLVHDCSKEEDCRELLFYAKNCGFPVDVESYNIPEILHGPASVYVSRTIFKIEDQEVLSSIRYHVTGRENMTLMEKIIFVADYIEPSREFEGVDKIRTLAYNNVDEALLYALNLTISFIIKKKGLLHHDTVDARNFLITHIKL